MLTRGDQQLEKEWSRTRSLAFLAGAGVAIASLKPDQEPELGAV